MPGNNRKEPTVNASDLYTAIFDAGASHELDEQTERDTIALAQTGDEDAVVDLCFAYARALRNYASLHTGRLGAEEARATAVAGLYEAIHAFKLDGPHRRLAAVVQGSLREAMRENDTTIVTVPTRQQTRYRTILRAAGGDVMAAADLAPQHEMKRSVFLALHGAVSAGSLEERTDAAVDRSTPVWLPDSTDAYADADARILAGAALSSVVGLERDVTEHAYGFVTGDPMTDAEVGQAISVRDLGDERVAGGEYVASRAKVQRARKTALRTMRDRLGVCHECAEAGRPCACPVEVSA